MIATPGRPSVRGATSDSWRSLRVAHELHLLLDCNREH